MILFQSSCWKVANTDAAAAINGPRAAGVRQRSMTGWVADQQRLGMTLRRETGSFALKCWGGDMRSRRIEERRAEILASWEARKDIERRSCCCRVAHDRNGRTISTRLSNAMQFRQVLQQSTRSYVTDQFSRVSGNGDAIGITHTVSPHDVPAQPFFRFNLTASLCGGSSHGCEIIASGPEQQTRLFKYCAGLR